MDQYPQFYQIEFQRVICIQTCPKKNHHLPLRWRGNIEYFLVVKHKVMKSFVPISTTCQDHFGLNTSVLDSVSLLIPVVKTNSFVCCFVESFVQKCLFMEFSDLLLFHLIK